MKAEKSTIAVHDYSMSSEILNGQAGPRPNKLKLILNTFMLETGRRSVSEEVSDPHTLLLESKGQKEKKKK